MLSRAQNKYIRSLTQQKFRNEHQVFIAEGAKIAEEWLRSDAQVQIVAATEEWYAQHLHIIGRHAEADVHIVTEQELATISDLKTPNQVLLVVHRPAPAKLETADKWTILLDNMQDPGNMGTIIRIADWFGVANVICSPGCVDVYNPKVVQAAMGGHLRVALHEADPVEFLKASKLPSFAATLHGEDIYKVKPQATGVLIIGNESKGISHELQLLATHKITIPRRGGAESLNAAVSAGIICSHIIS